MLLLIVLLVLVLTLVQAMIPGALLAKQVGSDEQMGPRDELPEPTAELSRARRALGNLHETLPIFLTVALLSLQFGEQGVVTVLGASVYLAGRLAHVVCYIKGLSPWRSYAFGVSILGILAMAAMVVPHIWN